MKGSDESSVHFWDLFRSKPGIDKRHTSLGVKDTNSLRNGLWFIVEAGTSTMDSVMIQGWHLLSAEWGQNYPWNLKMPVIGVDTCLVGCAPVAVSQVLHFFNICNPNPSGLYHSISEASRTIYPGYPYCCGLQLSLSRNDYTPNSPRWTQMSYVQSYGNLTGFEYASDLMLDVGVRLGTRYGLQVSGTPVNGTNNYFDLSPVNLSFSWGEYTYDMADTVMMNIVDRKPVIITAASSSDPVLRHTWVIDRVYAYRTFFLINYALWPASMVPSGATIVGHIMEDQLALQYPEYYPGMLIHERDGYVDILQFGMNFGYDGQHKYDFYSRLPSASWEGYDIIKSVHYNLSPGDLLIQ